VCVCSCACVSACVSACGRELTKAQTLFKHWHTPCAQMLMCPQALYSGAIKARLKYEVAIKVLGVCVSFAHPTHERAHTHSHNKHTHHAERHMVLVHSFTNHRHDRRPPPAQFRLLEMDRQVKVTCSGCLGGTLASSIGYTLAYGPRHANTIGRFFFSYWQLVQMAPGMPKPRRRRRRQLTAYLAVSLRLE